MALVLDLAQRPYNCRLCGRHHNQSVCSWRRGDRVVGPLGRGTVLAHHEGYGPVSVLFDGHPTPITLYASYERLMDDRGDQGDRGGEYLRVNSRARRRRRGAR